MSGGSKAEEANKSDIPGEWRLLSAAKSGCYVSVCMLNPHGPEALATSSCVLPRLFLTDFFSEDKFSAAQPFDSDNREKYI